MNLKKSKTEIVTNALRKGYIANFDGYKVGLGIDNNDEECIVIISKNFLNDKEVYLKCEDDLFKYWCNNLTDEEAFFIGCSGVLIGEKMKWNLEN